MDSERFDGLVRRFGQTRSRRQALRTLAGVAAGAVALGGAAAVEAGRCKNGKELCGKGKNACVDKQTDVNHCGSCSTDCTALANVNQVHCTNSICVIDSCATGFFNCDGNAGTGCEASSACCTPSCQNGLTCCNGTCTTLNIPSH